MYKTRKDKTKLIAQWEVRLGKTHYYHTFLWEDKESFVKNTPDSVGFESTACCCLSPAIYDCSTDCYVKSKVKPKLGELHFVKDAWDIEVVAHEVCHAEIHRIRSLGPDPYDIINQIDATEEDICYEFGELVSRIYDLLWTENPNKKWRRVS